MVLPVPFYDYYYKWEEMKNGYEENKRLLARLKAEKDK
jgi:hypothetical protein